MSVIQTAGRILPYLTSVCAVVELDRIMDVQVLAWPVWAALCACCAVTLRRRRAITVSDLRGPQS